MKYQNLSAFYKHLENAAPHQLCPYYFIVIPDPYERQKVFRSILQHLPHKPHFFYGGESSYEKIIEPFLALSLFEEVTVVCLNDLEKLVAKELARLKDWLQSPINSGFFICGSSSKTSLISLFEKNGVVLDLSEEKPWDKEKRITNELMNKVSKEKKRITPGAITLLFERVGKDLSFLDTELDKLISFIGEKEWIEEKEVSLITPQTLSATIWFYAEEIVWQKRMPQEISFPFSALIAPLRSQLHTGRIILSLLSCKTPLSEWSTYLPKIGPKILERRVFQAQSLGTQYFEKGLRLLFELEMLSRSGQNNEEALLFLFGSALTGGFSAR